MSDLIDRQAAIDATCASCSYDNCRYRDNGIKHASCDYVDRLKRVPSVKPEQKIGRWEFKQRGKYIDICCSKCGFQRIKEYAYNYTVDQISEQEIKDFLSNSTMNFCENCGCHMVEPQEGSDKE